MQGRGNGKIQKMHGSAVMHKCLKLAALLSLNHTKMPNLTGPRSRKNAKKLKDLDNGKMLKSRRSAATEKMPKTRRSAVMHEYKNCISQ